MHFSHSPEHTEHRRQVLAAFAAACQTIPPVPGRAGGSPGAALAALGRELEQQPWPVTARRIVADGVRRHVRWMRRAVRAAPERRALAVWARACRAFVAAPLPALTVTWEAHEEQEVDDELASFLEPAIAELFRFVPDPQRWLWGLTVQLLVHPPAWVPEPRPGLFAATHIVLEEEQPLPPGEDVGATTIALTPEGPVALMQQPSEDGYVQASRAIADLLRDDPGGDVLVSWTYYPDFGIGITDVATVRKHWAQIGGSGPASDVVVWPPDARWVLAFFHHGWLWVGRRKGEWPHRVERRG